ncbi:tetratricopeptide repeat protein [Microbulbifer sp. 2201CG32-9]|uniref:tetratricopeptide repeat protein n=1 Tax=unclassified Microbulbifer TaxID=2619833 RepID=UPI00345C2C0D
MTNPIIERLRTQLQEGRDSPLLRFGLGSALFQEKAFAEAAEHLQVCTQQMPDHSAAWKQLGRTYMALEQWESARTTLTRGLQVAKDRGDKQVEREIGVFLRKLDRLGGD